jgi:hypothetical protein
MHVSTIQYSATVLNKECPKWIKNWVCNFIFIQSEITIENKLLVYKTILKPIWTYGAPLWGSASMSNIEILQRFQNKVLRTIVNAPWYVPNKQLHTDLGISPVCEEITNISHKYKDKLTAHPNELATTLLNDEVEPQRLKRFMPADLMKQHI